MAQPLSSINDDQEVCSETLRVESKLFYLDLKCNARGRYLKIAEKGTNRERSTIIVPYTGIMWFRELFNYYSGGTNEAGPLVPKELPIETKAFYFEIGENTRGRFLRVSESGAGPRGRSSIIIPAGGAAATAWASFRNALARIEAVGQAADSSSQQEGSVDEAAAGLTGLKLQDDVTAAVSGSRTVVGPGPSPPTITETETGGQIVRAGHKRFFFDLGSNAKGNFLRITEVVGLERIAIVIPAEAMNQFQSALTTCQSQHASGIVSARTQPSLQQPLAPLQQPQPSLQQSPLQQQPSMQQQSPMRQQSSMQQHPATAPASMPAPPLAPPLHVGHGMTQVKHPLPGCGVNMLDPLPPVMFQPMWISPDGHRFPLNMSPGRHNELIPTSMYAMSMTC